MSKLDEAMQEHIAYIVLSEHRPFTYRDFLPDNSECGMKHGTFRNKIVALKKTGIVELDYYSGTAFYTLKGHRFGRPMTPDRMVVHNNPFYNLLQGLPLNKQSIHDIRLKFKVPNIWKKFSLYLNFHKNKVSQDIAIPTWNRNNTLIRTIIHKTDTVSVTISCSMQPIPLDADGIITFFNLLVRVEEKLQYLLENFVLKHHHEYFSIPDYKHWIVAMWHFGRDSLTEYNGERFSITMADAQHILIRAYSKSFKNKMRIRMERQECPNEPLVEIINAKLDSLN